jgi:hypothetical protein
MGLFNIEKKIYLGKNGKTFAQTRNIFTVIGRIVVKQV